MAIENNRGTFEMVCDMCGARSGIKSGDPGDVAEKARKSGWYTIAWGKPGAPLIWVCPKHKSP